MPRNKRYGFNEARIHAMLVEKDMLEQHTRTDWLNNMVKIDTVQIDIKCLSSEGIPPSSPWVPTVVDTPSGRILASSVTMDPINYEQILLLLKQAVM